MRLTANVQFGSMDFSKCRLMRRNCFVTIFSVVYWRADASTLVQDLSVINAMDSANCGESSKVTLCSPKSLRIDGETEWISFNPTPIAEGSGTLIYVSEDERVVAKTLIPPIQIRALCHERAVLKALEGKGVPAPHVHSVTESDPKCSEKLFLVLDYVGAPTIEYIRGHNPERLTGKVLSRIAARALEAFKKLHSYGIIHGDVHWGNMAVEISESGEVPLVELIDFGMSVAFVKDGSLIPQGERKFPPWTTNLSYLSPNQMEGYTAMPRDDLIRLADTC